MGLIASTLFRLVSGVPWWLWVAGAVALWGYSGHARHNALKQDVIVKTAQSEKEQRDEEQRRVVEQAKRMDKLRADSEQARLVADRARTAEQRLRKQLEGVARAGSAPSGDSATANGWSAAAKVGAVLGECVARYRELGEEAQRARESGLACEAAYESLVGPGVSETPERSEPVKEGEQ